jgi:hypothetical protein
VDSAAAAKAVQGFVRDWIHADAVRACALMAAPTKRNLAVFASQLGSQGCTGEARAVRSAMTSKILAGLVGVHVTGVRLDGDRGYVLYRSADGTARAFPVLREGSAWKVGAIVGQPVR